MTQPIGHGSGATTAVRGIFRAGLDPRNGPATVSANRGVVLWLVLGLGVAMAILSFSFYTMVREQNAKAHLIFFNQSAQSYAESGVNHAVDALRQALEVPASETAQAILNAGAGGLSSVPMPEGWEVPMQQFLPGGESTGVTVSVALEDVKQLWDPDDRTQGYDPGERTATLVITSTGTYRAMLQTVVERRPVKIVNMAMPVVSRFSLFVRNPDATDESSMGYNAYANEIGGAADPGVDTGSNALPIVLYNHEEGLGASDEIARHANVFLGGDRDLVLNLTSGGDFRFGQYFHFYNFLSLDTSRPAAFINDSPPTFFQTPHPYASQQQAFSIKHAFYGYFTVDQDPVTPSDMNRDGLLRYYFRSRTNMRSSTLHLFGSSLEPSPAKVFGNVYHSYPIYSAITVDVDGDGARDGIVKMLPAVAEDDYAGIELSDPIPTSIPSIPNPAATIELDPGLMRYSTLFGSYDTYGQFMSILVEREAYNTGVDYMKSLGEFPPKGPAFDTAADYPNSGTDVAIASWQAGSNHFKGDLGRLDGSSFGRKVILDVNDENEFKKLFLDGAGQLKLGGVVRIRQGGLSLPEQLRVVSGGAVLCPGTISVDQVVTPDDQVLTLCSTEKDISGNFGGKVAAHLIALKGQLKCGFKSRELSVHGTVAVDRLSASEFPAGGKIVFDERTDPSQAECRSFYRVYMSDQPADWRI